MKIEVLGPGCPKCQSTEQTVKKALSELGVSAEVVKVTDIDAIIEKGVLRTPALVIDGRVALQGTVPTLDQVKRLVRGA